MALNRLIAATVLALWPVLASGQASEWQRYVVAESGAERWDAVVTRISNSLSKS